MIDYLILLMIVLPFIIGVICLAWTNNEKLKFYLLLFALLGYLFLAIKLFLVFFEVNNYVYTMTINFFNIKLLLVIDSFAATMILLMSIICLLTFLAIIDKSEKEINGDRKIFSCLIFFLVAISNAIFLVADLLSLFLLFELVSAIFIVFLIRKFPIELIKYGRNYIVTIIFTSILFIIAITLLYAVAGTFKYAELSFVLKNLEQQGIINIIAILFMFVFVTRCGLLSMFTGLQELLTKLPVAIAGLYAVFLTNICIYSIIRMFTLFFNLQDMYVTSVFVFICILSLLFSFLGLVYSKTIIDTYFYVFFSHTAFLFLSLTIYTPLALAGILYFILHLNFVVLSVLFIRSLFVDSYTYSSAQFFRKGALVIIFIALVGLPPLSGFFTRMILLLAMLQESYYYLVAVSAIFTVITIFGIYKMILYANKDYYIQNRTAILNSYVYRQVVGIGLIVGLIFFLSINSAFVFEYARQIAEQMMDNTFYVNVVLGKD